MRLQRIQKAKQIIHELKSSLELYWIFNYEEIENNETINKVVNVAHKLALLSKRQRTCELIARTTLIDNRARNI